MAITTVPEIRPVQRIAEEAGRELRGHLSDRTPQTGQIDRQDPGAGTGGNRALCQTDQKTGAGGPH